MITKPPLAGVRLGPAIIGTEMLSMTVIAVAGCGRRGIYYESTGFETLTRLWCMRVQCNFS